MVVVEAFYGGGGAGGNRTRVQSNPFLVFYMRSLD